MGIIGQIFSKFLKGPAIQNLENVDVVVKYNDGGLLFLIICSKHLDGSEETLNLLRTKVANYILISESEEFNQNYPDRKSLLIELKCIKKPDERILEEIELFKKKYSDKGIKFRWKNNLIF